MPSDIKTNRECNVPFEDIEAANAALTAFYEEVGEARKKHKLANVYVIVSASAFATPTIEEPDASEGEFITNCFWGNAAMMEGLTAWAYGREMAEREEAILKTLGQHRRAKKK